MSAAIGSELQQFANCLWYGVVLFGIYDGLRVFRGLIRHAIWMVGLEDLIFWIWAGFYLFSRFFVDTYGAIRGYQLLGVGLGGVIWEYGCGKNITKKLNFFIRWLKFRIRRCKIFIPYKIVRSTLHTGCLKGIGMRSLRSQRKKQREKRMQSEKVKKNELNYNARPKNKVERGSNHDEKKTSKKNRKKRAAKRNEKKAKHTEGVLFQNQAAMIGISAVVTILFLVLLFHGFSLRQRVKENDIRLSKLQQEYEAEKERTKEIEELQEYMQSDAYIEKYAKEKIGLVKDNEIVFKENN